MLFDAVYFESEVLQYELGKELKNKYIDLPWYPIESHNKIEEMQQKENSEFAKMKRNLIIGTRKTHKYTVNHKISDYLVPYTSSGCTAMCMYCYLVCNYNKCAYLRLFVNRDKMLDKLKKTALASEKDICFEIGSNSDMVLENTITGNLAWTIENFSNCSKGKITFPTKFHMVEPLLGLRHQGKIIFRMSVNPSQIIKTIEFGTSCLEDRIDAVNKMCEAGYPTGILIAPVIQLNNWEKLYEELLITLSETLTHKVKKQLFVEIIFMTYSFVHRAINKEAFPNAINLFDEEKMKGQGPGKYGYKPEIKQKGSELMKDLVNKYLPDANIVYIC